MDWEYKMTKFRWVLLVLVLMLPALAFGAAATSVGGQQGTAGGNTVGGAFTGALTACVPYEGGGLMVCGTALTFDGDTLTLKSDSALFQGLDPGDNELWTIDGGFRFGITVSGTPNLELKHSMPGSHLHFGMNDDAGLPIFDFDNGHTGTFSDSSGNSMTYLGDSGIASGNKAALNGGSLSFMSGVLADFERTSTDHTLLSYSANVASVWELDSDANAGGFDTTNGVFSYIYTKAGNTKNYQDAAAFNGLAYHSGSGTIHALYGGLFSGSSVGAGTATSVYGIKGNASVYNGAATTLYGGVFNVTAGFTAGTPTTLGDGYGIYITRPIVTNHDVTVSGNLYGLYIEEQTSFGVVPGAYAIYTNAGKVHFGDAVDSTSTTVTSFQKITPVASPPKTCGDANTEGTFYVDTSHALCYCDGTSWQKLQGAGTCS